MLLGALNAGLVVVAARRFGLVAAGAAGFFYALWPAAAQTETTTRLEPLLSLGVLLALALLAGPLGARSRPGHLVAGGALGFALAVKIWAVVPVAVIWWWCRRSLGPVAARRVGLAAVGTALALYLPFWLAAPGPMTRMVVLDQLGRTRAPVPVTERLAEVLGGTSSSATTALTEVVMLLLVALALVGRRPLGRWAVGLLGLQLAVLLAGPPFFSFYAAYVVPALALVVAAAVATVGDALGWLRLARPAVAPTARAGALAVLGVGLLPLVLVDARAAPGVPLPGGELQALTATSRCVTSDSPGMLVLLDRLGRNLSRDCPVPVDVSGITYDSASIQRDGHHVPRAHNGVWQRALRRYLLSGGTTVVARPGADRLSPRTRSVLRRLPVLHQGEGYTLFAVPPALRTAVLPGHEPGPATLTP